MKDAFTETKTVKNEDKIKMNVADNDFVVKHRDDDPYGFWWISREKGQVPEDLRGAYTTVAHAQEAINTYLSS